MPLQLPVLDDRNFEQLLAEAKRRIPSYTPEWTVFDLESDPGITIVQLFAFLTESLLYRANRVPERNRLKFLQLLGVPLQAAAAAQGLIVIRNERGPLAPLPLDPGVIVAAGNVNFLTRDGVNVLPIEAQAFYKRPIPEDDPRFAEFSAKFEAVAAAQAALAEEQAADATASASELSLQFYETLPLPLPTAGNPNPVFDFNTALDRAVYLALLAPQNIAPEDVLDVIADKTLSIGIVPSLTGQQPLDLTLQPGRRREQIPRLIYEIADASGAQAAYKRLSPVQEPDVLDQIGIVQVVLPDAAQLKTFSFPEPLLEGTGDFPPRLEDEKLRSRLVTWLRLRLPDSQTTTAAAASSQTGVQTTQASILRAQITLVAINATRVTQAVLVVNELLGTSTGEPEQSFTLANAPVLPASIEVSVQDENGQFQAWRVTDDLLSASLSDQVFTLDPEAGQIRFGDGLHAARPEAGRRIRANYEFGGGRQGNVAIGAIKTTSEVKLQGGYKIENPLPTWGGDEGESVTEGERNIPLFLRHRDRLVTELDFKDITRRTPGVDVGRVDVLPLFHPQFGADIPGVVTLLVVPKFDPVNPRWPSPDRLFLRTICDYLDPRRLATTEVHVVGPLYVSVHLSVGVQVRKGFFRDVVLQAVRDRLNEYLSALTPGGPDGQDGDGWPLGKSLLQKDLEAVVTRVPGVELVQSMQMRVGGDASNTEERSLTGVQLPQLVTLAVSEGEAEQLSDILNTTSQQPPQTQILPIPVSRTKC